MKDVGDFKKIDCIKRHIKNPNFFFYSGGEIDLENKIKNGYNRLSSIMGNVYPNETKE